jgi:hypothetical protein
VTVTQVKLSSTGCRGKATGKGGSGSDAIEYTGAWYVECDAATDTAKTVLDHFKATSSLPWLGRQFSYSTSIDTEATCNDVSVETIPGGLGKFNVTATFATPTAEQGKEEKQDEDGKPTDDPTQWRDEIEISSTQISVPAEYATYIGPQPANQFLQPGVVKRDICNSAGVPYDPLPEVELDITIIRISKWDIQWNEALIAPYRGTINNDGFVMNKPDYNFSFPISPFVAKIKEWSGSFQIVNDVKVWKHTIEVHINPLGWRLDILDRGTTITEIDDDPESATYGLAIPKRLRDSSDFPLTEPQKLNGNGQLLPAGGNPVYLLYAWYREVPYAGINW